VRQRDDLPAGRDAVGELLKLAGRRALRLDRGRVCSSSGRPNTLACWVSASADTAAAAGPNASCEIISLEAGAWYARGTA